MQDQRRRAEGGTRVRAKWCCGSSHLPQQRQNMDPIQAFFFKTMGSTKPTVAMSARPNMTLGCIMSFLKGWG